MPLTRARLSLATALAVVVVAAACSSGGLRVRTARTDVDSTTTTEVAITEDSDDEFLEAASADVERFWEETFPEVYDDPYEPLDGGLHPYGPDTEIPDCGAPTSYEDVAGNAFYCPFGDFVGWDTTLFIPDLLEEFGPFTLAVVMAHEMGHAIQARADVPSRPSIMNELQADCFAGSWSAWVRDGNSDTFRPTVDDLDNAVAGMIELRDPLGTDPREFGAHGSAFDRIGAFQDGFQSGADRCARYEDGDFEVLELIFEPGSEDELRGGNLPFGEIEDLVLDDLENYWSLEFPDEFDEEWDEIDSIERYDPDERDELPDCPTLGLSEDEYDLQAFYCPDDDFIAWDEGELMPELHDDIGDFSVGMVIGTQYSRAAQFRLGLEEESIEANLQADCFTGTWIASVYNKERTTEDAEGNDLGGTIELSPGDLDESVQGFLVFRELQAGQEDAASAFQRTAALRDGFLHGLDQCMEYLEGGAPEEGD